MRNPSIFVINSWISSAPLAALGFLLFSLGAIMTRGFFRSSVSRQYGTSSSSSSSSSLSSLSVSVSEYLLDLFFRCVLCFCFLDGIRPVLNAGSRCS